MQTRAAIAILVIGWTVGCAGRLPPAAPPAAAPPSDGWVDFSRIAAETSIGKRLVEEERVFEQSRSDDLQKSAQALAVAEKRHDKDLATERQVVEQRRAKYAAEVQQKQAQDSEAMREAVRPAAAKVGRAHHLRSIDWSTRLWDAEDVTDEVIAEMSKVSH